MHDEKFFIKLNEISERLARLEVLMQESISAKDDMRLTLRDHELRINDLEAHKQVTIGAKDIITWLIVTAIAAWEVFK